MGLGKKDQNLEGTRMIKVGVIGVGVMGRNHARVYSELQDVELIGVADSNKEQATAVAREFKTKAFTSHKELLEQDLDAVTIAVPTSMHKGIAVDVANAGVDMLIEKPIAESIDSANEIISKCESNDVILMIGHIERFNPIIPIIKKSIKDSEVVSISITRLGPLPPRIKDVGVIVDLAVHDIDLIRFITESDFKKIYSLYSKAFSIYEDTAIISFEMENNILANIITSWLIPFKIREINIATKEKFIKGCLINQKVTEFSKYVDGSYIVKELNVPYGEPLKIELQLFLDSVGKRLKPAVTGQDGKKALEIALRCLK